MTKSLTLGFSPCPNDTFIFYGLVHGKASIPGIEFRARLEDVDNLNRLAGAGGLDITKVSYHAAGHILDRYALLRSGGALGRGCGPLIVARPGRTKDAVLTGTVAVPGMLTTAALLLRLYAPRIKGIAVMPYDRIMEAVAAEKVNAGIIIHESRFTYQLYGLEKIVDLGEWWEEKTNMPIPLGCIAARRSLGRGLLLEIESAIRMSLEYARKHRREALQYCSRHAQEMDPKVMNSHIDLYVNRYSLDIGEEGVRAVERLFYEGRAKGLLPKFAGRFLAEDIT